MTSTYTDDELRERGWTMHGRHTASRKDVYYDQPYPREVAEAIEALRDATHNAAIEAAADEVAGCPYTHRADIRSLRRPQKR
jgi:hypothetical protein